jgi:hypothetical protein
MLCDQCNTPAQQVRGSKIYPHRPDLHNRRFWYCDQGHPARWVAVGTGGTMADQITRYWRQRAHAHFDPVWQSGDLTRSDAYAILSEIMGITKSKCHISQFDYAQCKQVIEISNQIKQVIQNE